MAKRRTKKTVKGKANESASDPNPKDPPQFMDHQIQAMERQIAAIRAVRDVEIEHLLTELQLLRSRFSKEQLQKPVLQVFEETLSHISIENDEGNAKFDVRWKENDVHASMLQRLSIASMPPLAGFEYSTNAGRASFFGTDFKDIGLEELSETQTLAMQEGLQTPGVSSQRLSVGMTPKTTLRLPKPGEMLLSVHGSPLGVYKENNMEAIHESEEG